MATSAAQDIRVWQVSLLLLSPVSLQGQEEGHTPLPCGHKARPLEPPHDSTIGRYECGCGRSYKNKQHLHRHLKYECNRIPGFMCPHCYYMTKRKDCLKKHMNKCYKNEHKLR